MNKNESKQWLIDHIDENREEFCNASMEIWNHPELALQEYFAS